MSKPKKPAKSKKAPAKKQPKTVKFKQPVPIKRANKAVISSTPKPELTAKQELFVNEYLVDLNATAAYKRAGYKGQGRSAENAASQLLGNIGVQAAIKIGKDKRIERTKVDQDYVEEILTDTIRRCRQAVPVLDKQGKQVMVETENGELGALYAFDSVGVARCTDMLNKHVGYYAEDNAQKNPIHDLTDEQLQRYVERKAKEAGVLLH